jgi:predicted nucleic acid-binding protein
LSLAAEFDIFVNFVNETEETCKTVHGAGKIAFENKKKFFQTFTDATNFCLLRHEDCQELFAVNDER